jgi:hypothetical protein
MAPHHGAPQQEVNRGLRPCALVVYLSKEGEQGTPYSSLTVHVVPPHYIVQQALLKICFSTPCHGALQQEVNKGLHLCALVVYLGREEEQVAPYSSPTMHILPPLACMGLGNIKHKYGLICL